MAVASRCHPFTELRILHTAPTTGGVYWVRTATKKGHLFVSQTVNLENQLLECRRGIRVESAYILAYGDLEFCSESIDDEAERRAHRIELLQHFQPSCNQ